MCLGGLFPQMNILTITEGIKIDLYSPGNVLSDRKIDILEIGRKDGNFFKSPLPEGINHIKTGNFARTFQSDEEFRAVLADTQSGITQTAMVYGVPVVATKIGAFPEFIEEGKMASL